MAQERALTCPASLDRHRHCSWANLLAALMNVHKLCEKRVEVRKETDVVSRVSAHSHDFMTLREQEV